MLATEMLRLCSRYMQRTAPSIARPAVQMSRRLEGEVDYDAEEDAEGYRAIIAYCQRGLGEHAPTINHVLATAAKIQRDCSLEYLVCLFSFGWEDETLHHTGRAYTGRWNSITDGWSNDLCALAGVTDISTTALIPELFPLANPFGRKISVDTDDLLLFFCHNRAVRFSTRADQRYTPGIQKHAIWFFLGEDPVGIEMGSFRPTVLPADTPH